MKKIIICVTIFLILFTTLGGIFAYRNNRFSTSKKYDENNIGECYFQETKEEHIAKNNFVMYVDNEILVVAKIGVNKRKIEKLADKYKANIVGCIEQTGDYQWTMNSTYSIEELEKIASKLENEDIIDSASINYISEISESRLPVNYGKEWSGETWDENDHAGSNWGLEAVHALSAWDVLEEHEEKVNPIKLGLIDSGFDNSHEDLKDTFAEVFYNKSSDDHGTHVAGIMAANSDNNEGICGIYPYGTYNGKGNLYGVSYVGAGSIKENVPTIKEKCAFAELILRNVKVINCSFVWEYPCLDIELYNNKDTRYYIEKQADNFTNFFNRLIDLDYDFIIIQGAGNMADKTYTKLKTDENGIIYNDNGKVTYDDNGKISRIEYRSNGWFNEWYYKLTSNENEEDYKYVKVSNLEDENIKKVVHIESKYVSPISAIGYAETDEIASKVKDRIIVVGSIGIETNHSEALFDQTISISNGDYGYHISKYSNLGKRLDVVAPGGDKYKKIYSTLTNNSYGYMHGTSIAAPHVAGVAAMVWAANNNLTGAEVKEIICSTANNLISQPGSSYYKTDYKLVDAKSAVEKALGIEKEKTTDPQNGGILCWVVNKDNEDEKIEDATVTATNVETGKTESAKTDSEGHFELFLPEGNYTLTVTAKEYDDYTYNGIIEVKNNGVNYLDDWIKMKRSKGAISGAVVDELGNPIKNAHITANQTINNTLADKKATTDSNGYFKIECNTGNYKIKVTADGYEDYNYNKVINVEKNFDTILDTIKLRKIQKGYTESDLKEKVLAESGGNIGAWVYEDFDENGTKEAYAVITGNHDSITEYDHLEDIYFINGNGEITKMPGDFWGGLYYSREKEYEYIVCQGKGFFAVDSGNGGSGWQTLLYSVKDELPYELDISRTIQGFNKRDGIYYTTENEFLKEGGHKYTEVELIYNSSTQQFSKSNRIISEENNKISDWKSAYIEVLSNLNYSSARFITAYIDEDDIPELIVAYDSSHVAGCEIYTYYNRKVSKLEGNSTNGEFGSSGEILYLPHKNLFDSRYYGMGSNSDGLYRINNGNAQLECDLQNNDYFTTVRVIGFKIDGIERNENEYWDKYNSYEIDSMVSANYDDMIEVNSTNISNYFN